MKFRQEFPVFYGVTKSLKFILFILILSTSVVFPSNAETTTFAKAMANKKNGDYDKAEKQFRLLIKQDNSAESWHQLGLVQRFQQKHILALESQKTALGLSPDNQDIRLELARLHSWNQNYELAESLVKKILTIHPDYSDAQALALSIERKKNAPPETANLRPFKWQVDVGYENNNFARIPQPNWHHYFLQTSYWVREDTIIHFRVEDMERRNVHNQHYELGVSHVFNDNYNAQLSVGYTPNSVFIPKLRIKAAGEARLFSEHKFLSDTWLTGNVQYNRYSTLNSTVIKAGIRQKLFDDWQIQAQQIYVIDQNHDYLRGWSARLDWQTPIQGLSVFGGLSDAKEIENAIAVNVKAKFAGLSYKFNPQLTLHASYANEDRTNSFMRNTISTTLSVKF